MLHFNGNDGGDGVGIITDTINYELTLLWIHQSKWQRELLAQNGNTISLVDATYKYDLALFFVCAKTNVGYSVVAEFVVPSETAESISESLAKLELWNPKWCPLYFMSDYSEAELVAAKLLKRYFRQKPCICATSTGSKPEIAGLRTTNME